MRLCKVAVSWFCLVFSLNIHASCFIEGSPIDMSDMQTLNIIGNEIKNSHGLKSFEGVSYNPLNWRNIDEALGIAEWVNFLSKHPTDRAVMGEFRYTHENGTQFRLVCEKIEKHDSGEGKEFILSSCDWGKSHNTRGYLQGRISEKERDTMGLPDVKSHPIVIPLESCLCQNGS